MASNYDIAFLRVLMQQSLAERAQAMRCLQVIDEQAQRGQAVNAMQVVVRMGLVDPRQAERVDALARDELSRAGASGSNLATTSFRGSVMQSGVGTPPSGVGTPPSGVVARPAGLPPPPPPLPGQAPSASFRAPASTTQTLPPNYARSPLTSTPASGVARPPSGVLPPSSAPPPAPAPLGAPPPMPAPLGAPPPKPAPLSASASGAVPRPVSLPPGVSTAPIPRALTGEETMAGADLTFTRPPADAPPPGEGELYDLAENGQGLDDFFSGAKLGRGPVGTSYEGKRKSDGAPVVVKVLSRRFAQHPDLLAQVLEDVGAWSGLRHPSLAAALAMGVSNERHVIVLEHARGQTLEQHLAQVRRLEPRAALRVVYELAHALVAALERGLSHGDVRAAKVFFDGQRARLADPGLARASCLAAGFGQHGLAFGHPTYLAPEVLQEHLARPTPATDVYALGVLFYELVCGVPPFQGEVQDVLGKHFDAPLPPPPQGVTFSAAIAGLMLRMTAKSPSQRLPDARAVVAAITNLLEGKPIGPLPGARGARSPGAAISIDEWGRASQREDHKGISNHQWTVSKIEQAPAVGPADLGEPMVSDVGGLRSASTTGRLPREVVDEAALLAQAPGAASVGEKVGRGPVGTTYEGKLPGQATPVVVKVLSKKFSKHPDLVRRIFEGVKVSAAVNHPGVVRAVKAFQVGGRDMLVFERAQGRTLREVLSARGPFPWRQATGKVLELARALEAARRQGLSHGDVRPEKVFVDDAGRARLADFGLAEAACLGAGYGAAGMAFGHPNYLAPEVVQERRREPDERTDVYALGILYYELLTGRAPFQAKEPKRALVQHFEAPLPPPPEGVTVPTVVAELILRMTAKDPARRLASVSELVKRLEQTEVAASQDSSEALPSGEGPVSTSSAGAPSGLGPALDYDPGEDDVVSPDAWGNQSLELSKPSGEWAKAKIAEAPRVGPEEWTPDQSDQEDVSASGAAPAPAAPAPGGTTSVAKGTLAAAIQAAAVTRESAPDGAAAPAAGDSARVKKRAAAAGGATSARGKQAGAEGGNKKQLVVAVGGIVLTLLVMLVLVVRGGGDEKKVVVDGEGGGGNGVVVDRPSPPPPVEDPSVKQREALLKKLEREVKQVEDDVEDLVRSQRFKDAAARLADVSADARKEPALQARITGLEGRMQEGVSERYGRELSAIEVACEKAEFDRARSMAMAINGWSPDPNLAQQASQRVAERMKAHHRPVEQLQLGAPLESSVEAQLAERLQGWSRDRSILFQGGGVVVSWAAPDVLEQDVQVVSGAARVDAMPDGRSALRVIGEKGKPAFVVLELPLTRIVDATLDFVLTSPPGGGGQAALVMGARPPQPARGWGVAWGTAPVTLSPRGLQFRRTTPAPSLPLNRPLRMRLSMEGDNRLSLMGLLWIDGEPKGRSPADTVDAGQSSGRVGLWVEEAEVWITGLEVRGLVDPAGLR